MATYLFRAPWVSKGATAWALFMQTTPPEYLENPCHRVVMGAVVVPSQTAHPRELALDQSTMAKASVVEPKPARFSPSGKTEHAIPV